MFKISFTVARNYYFCNRFEFSFQELRAFFLSLFLLYIMNRTFFFLIITLIISAFAFPPQNKNTYNMPIDSETGKITYVEVVAEKGSADELYERAYEWAKKYFVNISSTIKTRNKEAGLLEGNTRFKVYSTDKKGKQIDAGVISFDFKIEFKQDKYRVVETNFRQADNSGNAVEDWFEDTNEKAIPIHQEIFKQIDLEARKMIDSLKEGMKPVVKTSDEW